MRKKLYFRYWLSFIILIVLLLVFIFWNINSGSISISLKDIFQILFHKNGDKTATNTGGSDSWRSAFSIRVSSADIFWKPDRRSFCTWYFIRCKTDRGTDNDLSAGKIYGSYFRSDDSGCVYRISDIHGICAFDLTKGKADVHACCKWYYDWIYLFCDNRFCGYFCR